VQSKWPLTFLRVAAGWLTSYCPRGLLIVQLWMNKVVDTFLQWESHKQTNKSDHIIKHYMWPAMHKQGIWAHKIWLLFQTLMTHNFSWAMVMKFLTLIKHLIDYTTQVTECKYFVPILSYDLWVYLCPHALFRRPGYIYQLKIITILLKISFNWL